MTKKMFVDEIDGRGWLYRRAKGVQRAATPPASHVFMRYKECKRSGGVWEPEVALEHIRALRTHIDPFPAYWKQVLTELSEASARLLDH